MSQAQCIVHRIDCSRQSEIDDLFWKSLTVVKLLSPPIQCLAPLSRKAMLSSADNLSAVKSMESPSPCNSLSLSLSLLSLSLSCNHYYV